MKRFLTWIRAQQPVHSSDDLVTFNELRRLRRAAAL